MSKKAFITGITGQDGSYMADLLLSKGYVVHGIYRKNSQINYFPRIRHIINDIKLYECDITSYQQVYNVISKVMPDEVYHFAAQSFVWLSFKDEFTTFKINCEGTNNILSSVYNILGNKCKFYFAASSEMFGNVDTLSQNEETKFNPVSPYGISKCFGYYLTKLYREQYGMFAVSGILFNHESERRGDNFVTKKIADYFAYIIKSGNKPENKLTLGNLNSVRDWGYAPEYMEAVYLMMQNSKPIDYVVGTGTAHSINDIINYIQNKYNIDCYKYIEISDYHKRPKDVVYLKSNPTKIYNDLNWKGRTNIYEIIDKMITSYSYQ